MSAPAQVPQTARAPASSIAPTSASSKGRLRAPWAVALAVSAPLAAVYALWTPTSGDLAAATYRANLFSRVGFVLWDGGWYGGHYLPGYSLLSPALGAALGEHLLLALSAIAASVLFGVLIERAFDPGGARVAAGLFALGLCVELLSGRVAYDLGIALGLGALVALQRARGGAAFALAIATSAASPVAGAFLGLAGLACALAETQRDASGRGASPKSSPPVSAPPRARSRRPARLHAAAMTIGALAPVALLSAVFPEGGYEPFAPSVFWPGVAGVLAIAVVLPRIHEELPAGTERALRWGAWLYIAALVGSYALQTPVGSNAARLGELVATPLVAGALWTRHRLALAILAPVLLYWQLETPLNDYAAVAGDPSTQASYYTPLIAELDRLSRETVPSGRPLGGGTSQRVTPMRIEIPQMGAHWESVYVPREGANAIVLARGWERQLDTRYAALFYKTPLPASEYRNWLAENAVSYVALPDARLDYSASAEGALIKSGLPYLREVWRARHWRLFAVRDATPLAQRPAVLTELDADRFALWAPRAGRFVVRVRYTPYWALSSGAGCVSEARHGWTLVSARAAGSIGVGIDFSVARILNRGPRCRS